MKVLISIILVWIFFPLKSFSQENKKSIVILTEEEQVSRAKLFFELLDSIKKLKYDIRKLSKRAKTEIGLVKAWDIKRSALKVIGYDFSPIVTERTWFTGGFLFVVRKGKPFCISGGYSILSRENVNYRPQCDTILYKAIKKSGIELPRNNNNWRNFEQADCYGDFQGLDDQEIMYIKGVHKNDSIQKGLLSEYLLAFEYKELLNSEYDFDYDKSYKDKHIFNPIWLKTLVLLYDLHDFTSIKKLLYTKNIMFNWMVAEALLLYNKFKKILTKKELRHVESYNGKNGFAKFRSEVKVLCGYYTKGVVPNNARW